MGHRQTDKVSVAAVAVTFLVGYRKTKQELRHIFRNEGRKTKKAPEGAFFKTQFNPDG
ncbi:hypothetical protein ACXGQP_07960 [Enterobacter oligotrophicus]|uniref:hypothetical protein n=1 Tax=Enterobacter oligotrophicus TaxID=2478464 RepID=UPI0023EF7BC2|nr:hypothetical protein [Enterobacter oligotrophicus]